MKYGKLRGIVVRTVEYLESDRLLTVLTFEEGAVTIKAKGVRKKGAKLAFAAGQFFCGDFEIVSSRGRYVLIGASALHDYSDLASDIEKYYYACHFIDIASSVIMENHPDEEMLRFLLNSLHIMAKGKCSLVLLGAIFEFRTASLTGFAPVTDECAACGENTEKNIFSIASGGYICCGPGIETDTFVRNAIRHIVESDMKELFSLEMPEESAKELKSLSGEYIENIFDKKFMKLNQLEGI